MKIPFKFSYFRNLNSLSWIFLLKRSANLPKNMDWREKKYNICWKQNGFRKPRFGNNVFADEHENQCLENGTKLATFLSNSSKLESLEMILMNFRFPIMQDLQLTHVVPYLKYFKVEFLPNLYKDGEELLVEKILAECKLLERLTLCYPCLMAPDNRASRYHRMSGYRPCELENMEKLPDLLKRIPEKIHVGLQMCWGPHIKPLIRKIIEVERKLAYIKLWVKDIDKDLTYLVRTYLFQHMDTVRSVHLVHRVGIRSSRDPPSSIVFQNCKKLIISSYSALDDLENSFPNLRRLEAGEYIDSSTIRFIDKLTALEELEFSRPCWAHFTEDEEMTADEILTMRNCQNQS